MTSLGESSATDTVIEARDLRCSYGDFDAVKGIDLDVRRGELFALLGTNGAGKTTTMETLEGHRAPTSGTVRVLGLDPAADRKILRPRVGIMLQETGFAGDLTVRETVRMWAALTTDPTDVGEALARVDLTVRADTRVVQLSGGQKRRLDLALATLGDPEVLFLDEPTSGLDPESRARTWELVRELKARGTTIVLTTHYLEEAEELADHVAIMNEGRIAVSGTVASVVGGSPARITFALPTRRGPHLADELRQVVDPVDVTVSPAGVRLDVEDLQDSLWRLLRWADTNGIRLDRLGATEASLGEVFGSISRQEENA